MAINVAILAALLVPVELIFGTWLRPMSLRDLKRFSIPIGSRFEFDTSELYSGDSGRPITYSRDQWGLRGSHRTLGEIDVLTIGGSTTEQRYLDDSATWQAVAQRQLSEAGHPLVIANAGVDGQSTVGHLFSLRFWFPLLQDLRPTIMLFYVGANDALRHDDRADFDASLDATSWRVRSATYQLLRTVRNNFRARSVGVYHGRMRAVSDLHFTEEGRLDLADRSAIASRLTATFVANLETLRQQVLARGAVPIFMTQTAFAWTADPDVPSRGLTDTVSLGGFTVNFADVSFLHQALNRALLAYCTTHQVTCFDLASDVAFDADDYYDYLHNTPRGAAKIGHYLAERLSRLDTPAGVDR